MRRKLGLDLREGNEDIIPGLATALSFLSLERRGYQGSGAWSHGYKGVHHHLHSTIMYIRMLA
jgi:hypothetical protein